MFKNVQICEREDHSRFGIQSDYDLISRRKAETPRSSRRLIRAENERALILPTHGYLTDDDLSSTESQWTRESSSDSRDTPIFQTLQQPWTHLALPLFINLFTTSLGRDPKQGFLTFLPRLYHSSTPNSALHLAVSAATGANAIRKLTDPDDILHARRSHVQALAAVQKAIEDPKTATKDTTLCSLFILTLFEVSRRF